MLNGEEFGSGGVVVIPDVVMHHLEMPKPFAGACVEGKKAIAEQISARPIGAIEIVFGAGSRNEDYAAFRIDCHFAPGICAANGFPGVFGPSVMTEFTFVRNGVEDPTDCAGANVERADIAWRGAPALIGGRAENEEIFEHSTWVSGLDKSDGLRISTQTFFQIDAAGFTE